MPAASRIGISYQPSAVSRQLPLGRLLGRRAACLALLLAAAGARADEPVFVVRTTAGKDLRGALRQVGADGSVRVGPGKGRRVAGDEVVSVRAGRLPPLPGDEHLILANGDRVPAKDVRLEGEKLLFTHPALSGGKESSVPLAAVAVVWRTAPDRTAHPEKLRRALAAGARKRDMVLLRNGDVLEGVLNKLDHKEVEVEAGKKAARARLGQVAAVALSTELADRLRPKGPHARLVLEDGARLTLLGATCDGKLLRGKTPFGALVRVPVEEVAALDPRGGRVVYLSDLEPSKYEFRPFLDERWPWSADAAATGRDLRVGGATYDKGLGAHSHSLLTYKLGGAYKRFEAVVGLDDRDGRKGSAAVRVLADGKPLALGRKGELTHAGGPWALSLPVDGVRELTLEVGFGAGGPVQDVVNWADARLIK